eukprot:EG_transcript_351
MDREAVVFGALFRKVAEAIRDDDREEGRDGDHRLKDGVRPKRLNPAVDPHRPHFLKYDAASIPQPILEEYRQVKYKCDMGIFPSVNRAWISVDNKLLLWNYVTGADYFVFDQSPQVLLAVGLVTPPAGLFHPEVAGILVLSTPVQVIFVAMGFRDSAGLMQPSGDPLYDRSMGELKLCAVTPTVATYDVGMTKIVSTSTGRVFLGSETGCLYEVLYTASAGWDSTRLRLVNHSSGLPLALQPFNLLARLGAPSKVVDLCLDETQGLLYTLLHTTSHSRLTSYSCLKSTIEVWSIGGDLRGSPRRLAYTTNSTAAADSGAVPEGDELQPIISIHAHHDGAPLPAALAVPGRPDPLALPAGRRTAYNLVAVTLAGDRIFYQCSEGKWLVVSDRLLRRSRSLPPDVRPPQAAPSAGPITHLLQARDTMNVEYAFYNHGATLLCDAKPSPQGESYHAIYGIASQKKKRLPGIDNADTEDVFNEIDDVAGNVLCISELPRNYLDPQLSSLRLSANELATQHLVPARRFFVLTSLGFYTLLKLRPVDHLHLLLLSEEPSLSRPLLKDFHAMYGTKDLVSMLLTLVSASQTPGAPTSAPDTSAPRGLLAGPSAASGPARPTAARTALSAGGLATAVVRGPGLPVAQAAKQLLLELRTVQRAEWRVLDSPALRPGMAAPTLHPYPGGPAPEAALYQLRSDMLEAFVAHFGRLVGPFWHRPLFVSEPISAKLVGWTFSARQLELLRNSLEGLMGFFLSHQFLTTDKRTLSFDQFGLDGMGPMDLYSFTYRPATVRGFSRQDAQLLERLLLTELRLIVQATLEAVGFLVLLNPYYVEPLTYQLPMETRSDAMKMTLGMLVERDGIAGQRVVQRDASGAPAGLLHELVKAVLEADQTGNADPAEVQLLVQRLSENCGLYFKHRNVKQYQALECVRQARLARDQTSRLSYLQASLQLLKEVGKDLYPELFGLCEQYSVANYVEGIVELCTDTAAKIDPDGAALRWYKAQQHLPEGVAPQPGEAVFQPVWQCYQVGIKKLLRDLETLPTDDLGSLTMEQQQRLQLLLERTQYMLGFNVELWHYAIFGWYASKLRSFLPKLPSPYLERYLEWNLDFKKTLGMQLCDYYLLVGKYQEAAYFFGAMALSANGLELSGEDRPFTLEERLSFLSAAMNAANLGSNRALVEQTQNLMQVAHVQLAILEEFRVVRSNPLPQFWTAGEREALEHCYVELETKLCQPDWMYTECQRYAQGLGNYARFAQPDPTFYALAAVRFYQCSLQLLAVCHPNEGMDRIGGIYVPLLKLAREAEQLRPQVLQLARLFYGHPNARFFPLTLIISALECVVITREYSESTVVEGLETLLEAGVQYDHIYKGYRRLYEAVVSNTVQEEPLFPEFVTLGQIHNLQMHMLIVLCELIRCWFGAVQAQPDEALRREFNLHKLALNNDIDQYKTRCGAMPSGAVAPVRPAALKADFETLQRRITEVNLFGRGGGLGGPRA